MAHRKRTDYYVDQPTVKARLIWLMDSGLCPYSTGSDASLPQGYVCLRRPREIAPKPCSYVDWLTCPVGGLARALTEQGTRPWHKKGGNK